MISYEAFNSDLNNIEDEICDNLIEDLVQEIASELDLDEGFKNILDKYPEIKLKAAKIKAERK